MTSCSSIFRDSPERYHGPGHAKFLHNHEKLKLSRDVFWIVEKQKMHNFFVFYLKSMVTLGPASGWLTSPSPEDTPRPRPPHSYRQLPGLWYIYLYIYIYNCLGTRGRGFPAARPSVGTRLGRIAGPRRGFARPARRPGPDGHPRRPGDPTRCERGAVAFRPRPIGCVS